MFRISFDPAIGGFVIQVLRFGLFWVNVRRQIAGPGTPVEENFEFQTYEDARKHVASIGLDQLYCDRSENVRREYLRTT